MRLQRMVRRFRGDERGAALVEFALVVPLLMAMMCVIIDFGLALYTLNSIASAAREGARMAAVKPTVTANDPTIQNRADAVVAKWSGDTYDKTAITVTEVTDPGTTLRSVRVTVPYTFRSKTGLGSLFGMGTITMTRSAVYRLEWQ